MSGHAYKNNEEKGREARVHILSTMLARWHVDNVVELCLKTLYFMRNEAGTRLGLTLHLYSGGLVDTHWH